MQRVVVTGMGIVSCLGNSLGEVSTALREGRSGITRMQAWRERGFGTHVAGVASATGEPPFDRKLERFMGETARFACHATRKAIHDSGLDAAALRSPDVGAVIGSSVGAIAAYDTALSIAHTRGIDKIPPYTVPQVMSNTASANVAQVFGLEGVVYSPSAACATSALAIGQALQLIQSGRQQIVLAGGSESLHDNTTLMFDAMHALSRRFNDAPEIASRPFDIARDGFVIASGSGVLVLEALDHALERGARIYAELTGFGQSTHGAGMVTPHMPCMVQAMRAAMAEAGVCPSYINAHAPSTPLGDIEELRALCEVFGNEIPPFSSTKGLTGHPLGACGVHEAIYTLLMMRDGFMAGTACIESVEPLAQRMPLIQATRQADLDCAMSLSFGFGGSCASLVFEKIK